MAGTVDDFDTASYAASLAAEVGVMANEVHLSVTAASVVVVAMIRPATPAAIPTVEEQALALSQRSISDASSRLGVTVEAMSAPYTEAAVLAAPSPPPPSPPPPGMPPPPPSPPPHVPPMAPHSVDMVVVVGAASGGGLVGLIVVGGVVAVAVVCYRRQTKGGAAGKTKGGSNRKKEKGANSKPSSRHGKGKHAPRERADSTEGPHFGRCGSLIEPSDSRHDSSFVGSSGSSGGDAAAAAAASSKQDQDIKADVDDTRGSLGGIVTEGSGGGGRGGGALPLGWEEFVAPGSGKRLYYCAVKDEHTTVRPKASATEAIAPLTLEVSSCSCACSSSQVGAKPAKSPSKMPPPPPPEAYLLSPRVGGARPTAPAGCVQPPPMSTAAAVPRSSARASQRGSQAGGGGNAFSHEGGMISETI